MMSDLEHEIDTNPHLIPYDTLLEGFQTMRRERDEAIRQRDVYEQEALKWRDHLGALISDVERCINDPDALRESLSYAREALAQLDQEET